MYAMTDSLVNSIHENIHHRQSVGHLIAPAPNTSQLEMAFNAALTAPDHHRIKPTRFVVIPSEQRAAFGELLAEALSDMGELDPTQLDRVKQHPFRAPLLVLALTKIQEHPKVPIFEQILSTGAAVQIFLLSMQAQGFSTMWRTGKVVESTLFKSRLGLKQNDLISGIIYVGTAAKPIAPRAAIETGEFVSEWSV